MGGTVELKKGKIDSDKKQYETDKNVKELLSTNLNKIKEKYKATENDVEQIILSADDSFENYKKSYKDSLNYTVPNVKPLGSTVITSKVLLNLIEYGSQIVGQEFNIEFVNQLSGAISEKQVVVAKGPHCTQVEIGDTVSIRLSDFTRRTNPNTVNSKEQTFVPVEEINGEEYLVFNEGNIKYINIDEGYKKRREDKK